MTKKYLDELTYNVVGAAIKIHKSLGPGLIEAVYHRCMIYELSRQGIKFTSGTSVPIYYDEIELETHLRCDLFIEGCLVLELKSVEQIKPIYTAQLLTYMKLLHVPKGILINFNCVNLFAEGQKTYVNDMFSYLPDY